MQNHKDAFTLPTGRTIRHDDITIDELLMLSDPLRDLQQQLKLSKPVQYDPILRAPETQLEDINKRSISTEYRVTDEDLIIEEILGSGGASLEQVLREIQESSQLEGIDQHHVWEPDRNSTQRPMPDIEPEEKPQYIIDYVELLEREPYSFLTKNTQLEHESFLFTHYQDQLRKDRIEAFRYMPDSRVKMLDDIRAQVASQLQKLKQTPKSIQWYADSQKEMFVVGLSRSSIMMFIIKCTIPFNPGQAILLPFDNSVKPSIVGCLEFTDNGNYLLSCTQEAQFLFYSLGTLTNPKLLKVFSGVHTSIPLCMQIFGEQMGAQYHITFVTCDVSGVLQSNKIRQTTFSYGIEKNVLLSNTGGSIYLIQRQLIKYPQLQLEAIATVSKRTVMVIVLEPFIDIVFKKEYVPKGLLLVKWQLTNDSAQLLLSNGPEIQLISMQCNREQKKVDLKFEIVANLVLKPENHIDALHWLSRNVIFVKVDKLQYYLLDTTKFQTGDKQADDEQEANNDHLQQALVAAGVLENEISDQKYSWENHTQLYLHTYTIVSRNNKIAFLESSMVTPKYYFMYRQLSVWFDFIEMKIDSRDWNYCLALLLQMYSGHARYFAELPIEDERRKTLMRPYLNEFIIKYIQHVAAFDQPTNEKQELESWKNTTTRAVEFLTKAESLNFLFVTLRGIYKKMNKDNIFLDCLEPFILRNEITYIPREALKDVIYHLKANRKLQTLKQLIINLDTTALDPGQIISICIEYNLFTPLIYISPRVDDDYFTPIAKMFAIYANLINEYEQIKGSTLEEFKANLILNQQEQTHIHVFWQDLEIDHPNTQQEILKEIKLQGYRCLWYLHLCFQGKLFPRDDIPREKWGRVLTHMMIWTFAEETLTLLLNLNPSVTFNEILLLFHKPQIDALKHNEDECIGALRASYKRNNNRTSLTMQENYEVTVTNVILEVLQQQINQDKYQDIYELFLSEVLMLCPNIPLLFAFKGIKHMLKNPYQSLYQEALKSSHRFLKESNVRFEDDDEILVRKENAICSYLMLHREQFNQYLLSEVLTSAQDSPFVEVRCQVHFIRNQYNECVDQFIHSSQPTQRAKVFNYIDRFFRSITDIKALQSLMRHLIANIRELVVIDPERTSVLLDSCNESDFKEAIVRLNEFPALKFKLLQKIVAKKRANRETLEDKLMVDFFELTCKMTPERAQEELKYGDFPQDLCLQICRRYRIQAGEAYLMEKSGSVVDAINLYFDIFITNLNQLFQNESALLQQQKQLHEFMLKKIQPCFDICRENNKKGDEESEFNWFLLIDRISKLRQKYRLSNKLLMVGLTEIYQSLLQEVLNKVELKSVFDHLENLIGQYSFDEVKMTFQQLLTGYSYEQFLLMQTLHMIREDVQHLDQDLYFNQSRGTRIQPFPQRTRKCAVHKLCETLLDMASAKAQTCQTCLRIPENELIINLKLAEQKIQAANKKRRVFLDQKESSQQDGNDSDEIEQDDQGDREAKMLKVTKWRTYDLDREAKWERLSQYSQ